MKRLLLALVCMAVAGVAVAADLTLADALAGKAAPLKLKLKELGGDWYRVNLDGSQGAGGANAAVMRMYAGMLGGASAGHYTRGETVKIEGETFLVAYRLTTKPLDYMAMMRGGGQPPAPEKPTPDSVLELCLVRANGLEAISDIKPFDLVAEIAGNDASPEALAAARAQVAESSGLGHLAAIGEALTAYAQDGDKTLPAMKDAKEVATALSPYCKVKNAFTSPDTKELYQPNASLSGRKLADMAKPAETVAFYDAKPVNGQRAVLYLNGKTERVNEAKWATLKKASLIP